MEKNSNIYQLNGRVPVLEAIGDAVFGGCTIKEMP